MDRDLCVGAEREVIRNRYIHVNGRPPPGEDRGVDVQQQGRKSSRWPMILFLLLVLAVLAALALFGVKYAQGKKQTGPQAANIEMPPPQTAPMQFAVPAPMPQPLTQTVVNDNLCPPHWRGVDFGLQSPGQAPSEVIHAGPPVPVQQPMAHFGSEQHQEAAVASSQPGFLEPQRYLRPQGQGGIGQAVLEMPQGGDQHIDINIHLPAGEFGAVASTPNMQVAHSAPPSLGFAQQMGQAPQSHANEAFGQSLPPQMHAPAGRPQSQPPPLGF